MERRKSVMNINLTSSGALAAGVLLNMFLFFWLAIKAAMKSYDSTSHRLAAISFVLLILAIVSFIKALGIG
jgi:hypothetical protein